MLTSFFIYIFKLYFYHNQCNIQIVQTGRRTKKKNPTNPNQKYKKKMNAKTKKKRREKKLQNKKKQKKQTRKQTNKKNEYTK